jgi:predicted phage terminase large subunit-like protein
MRGQGLAREGGNRRTKGLAPDFLAPGWDEQSAPSRGDGRPIIPLNSSIIGGFCLRYLYAGYDEPVASPPCHIEWWDMCCSPRQFVAIAAPRDHAKSTAVTHAYTLACMLFRQRQFCVIISSTYEIAVEFLRGIAQELSENDDLRRDFQIVRFLKDSENNLIVQLADGYTFRIVARGAEQKMRGLKWKSLRPDLMIFDDVEEDEQVESKERREKFSKWVMRAAIPAGKKNGCLYRVVGTVLHFDSFLEKCLRSEKVWHAKRYKAHEGFDDFSNVLWPSKYDAQWFQDKRQSFVERGDPDGYSQEYLNNPVSEQDAYFYRTDLLPYPEGSNPLTDATLRRYAGWDLAVTKDDRGDYTVCVVVGVDAQGLKYVLDVRRGRMDGMEIVEEILNVQKTWKPEFHAFEKGVIEKSIEPFLNEAQRTSGRYISPYKIASTKDKRQRARAWQSATRAHHVFYNHNADWFLNLQEEMTRFPRAAHDDQVDAQSILGLLLEDLHEGGPDAQDSNDEADQAAPRSRWDGDFDLWQPPAGRNLTTGY